MLFTLATVSLRDPERQHHGRSDVKSVVGKGSSFEVLLPIETPRSPVADS